MLGEHGEAQFGWGTDCMRDRERRENFSGAWKPHRAGGGKKQGGWAVAGGGLRASSRLKGRVDRPLAEIKLQP